MSKILANWAWIHYNSLKTEEEKKAFLAKLKSFDKTTEEYEKFILNFK